MGRQFILWEDDLNGRLVKSCKPKYLTLKSQKLTVPMVCNAAALDALDADPLLAQKVRDAAVAAVSDGIADLAKTLRSYERIMGKAQVRDDIDGFRMDFRDLYDEKVETLCVQAQGRAKQAFDKAARTLDDYKQFKVDIVKKAAKGLGKSVGGKVVSSSAPAVLTGGLSLALGLTYKLGKVAWNCYVLCRDIEKDLNQIDKKIEALGKLIANEGKGKKAAARNMAKSAAGKLPGVDLAPGIKEIDTDIKRAKGKLAKLETQAHKLSRQLGTLLSELDKAEREPAVKGEAKLKSAVAGLESAIKGIVDDIIGLQETARQCARQLDEATATFAAAKAAKVPGAVAKKVAALKSKLKDSRPGAYAERKLGPRIKQLNDAKARAESQLNATLKKWV